MLFFLKIIAKLPDRVLYILADMLAWILRCVVRYRRATVDKNLLLVFPDEDLLFRQDLAKRFYCHLADVVVEILMLSRLTPEELSARVEIVGLERLEVCAERKLSTILLSAHQGNWEWMLASVAAALSFPLDALYRPLHNPSADRFFMDMRTRFGAGMIPAENAARVILKLRQEVHAFGILADQNPRRKDEKYWTTFMGIETPVVIGPERIAKLTGYPLFYVATERVARGRYRILISPLAEAPYNGNGEVSQKYMDAVDAHVRRQPESWMWSHHRWRYSKAECPRNMAMAPKISR
ncbi:MAG TPA: lysophospholipid acyltransferase family protein [Cellvibrio sp.]|nr:lysophospholipid acyltransferase family protein [Cellvibrio sp.]